MTKLIYGITRMLSALMSLFDEEVPTKDPWSKWRNKGGPISAPAGEALLFFVGIGVVIYMIVRF